MVSLSTLIRRLTPTEFRILKKLNTPIKIQNFLDTLPINFEEKGETYMSVRRVLREKKAHCLEGALLAALALYLNGHPPLLLDFKVELPDEDHVVAIYKVNGLYGAISKTNHATLRYRDPVYKTVRELAISYFHEYFINGIGKRTLRKYSDPIDLRKLHQYPMGRDLDWVTGEEELWDLPYIIDKVRHHALVPKKTLKFLRKADAMELKAAEILEWKTDKTK